MRRSLSSCLNPSYLGVSIATSLCAGALLASPALTPVFAAPTVGGDENGPQVQILQPGYQDVLKGKTKILIGVKAQKFNPQFVEMFIDDKPATSGPIALTALPSAQYDWDTKLFTDGPHKLTVRITDTQGFRGWAEVNVYINNEKKVDNTPPSLNWQNLTSFQELSGKTQIQLDAVDNFGVKWIIVSVNPASDPNRKPALRSWLLNRPPYVVNFDTTAVPDGLYQLSAKAWDSFEQEGKANSMTLGVVNSGGINATTISQMLDGMKKIDAANSQPAATNVSASPKFTVPVPDDADGTSNTNVNTANANTANVSATNPYLQKAPGAVAAKINKATNTVIVKQGAAAPKVQQPKTVAPMIVTQTQTTPRKPVVVAEIDRPVAAPQLSSLGAASVASTTSVLGKEIDGAVNEDWRGRIARTGMPQADSRAVQTDALLSATKPGDVGMTRLSAPTAPSAEEVRSASFHTAVPTGSERTFQANASARPDQELPTLSQNSGSSLHIAPSASLKVAAATVGHVGRASDPNVLVARAEVKPQVSTPSLSAPATQTASRVASHSAATLVAKAPEPSRSAVPAVSAERGFDGTQISSSPALPSTQVSATSPRLAKADVPASALPSKSAAPDARFAALPRSFKAEPRSTINAITVSPLEVKTSDSIPAFHVAARATDLRAVAARYGLPVAVVAACNEWPENKTLVAGEKVLLPHQLKVSYQGVPVHSDAPSMLVGGTGVTAFRFMFQQAGGKLEWDAKRQRVIARKGASEVVLTIGSNKAKVGNKDVMMELAAFLFEGRTMVPVRFFEEGLHAHVDWDPQTGRLVVAMAN